MTPIQLASGKTKTIQPNVSITSISGSNPYTAVCASAHGLENGDIVAISSIPAMLFTVTVVNSTTLQLNETSGLLPTQLGGTLSHVGYATPTQSTNGTAIPPGTSFGMHFTIDTLNQGTVRAEFEDCVTNTNNVRPGPTFCTPIGPISTSDSFSQTSDQWPNLRVSNNNDQMRLKVFADGGPGTTFKFDASLY